jgi:hypothetical protein
MDPRIFDFVKAGGVVRLILRSLYLRGNSPPPLFPAVSAASRNFGLNI